MASCQPTTHQHCHENCGHCNARNVERVNCTAKFTTRCHVRGMRSWSAFKLKNHRLNISVHHHVSSVIKESIAVSVKRDPVRTRTIFAYFRILYLFPSISSRQSTSQWVSFLFHRPILPSFKGGYRSLLWLAGRRCTISLFVVPAPAFFTLPALSTTFDIHLYPYLSVLVLVAGHNKSCGYSGSFHGHRFVGGQELYLLEDQNTRNEFRSRRRLSKNKWNSIDNDRYRMRGGIWVGIYLSSRNGDYPILNLSLSTIIVRILKRLPILYRSIIDLNFWWHFYLRFHKDTNDSVVRWRRMVRNNVCKIDRL